MILSANKNRVDPVAQFVFSTLDANVPLVEVSLLSNYEFNPELLSLKAGGYVLADYCEYGAKEWDRSVTHIFGRNTYSNEFAYKFQGEEWAKFDQWVKDNPPLLVFKRELLAADVSDYILPVEYPSLVAQIPPAVSREEFDSRPLELFHYWGWSHESRRTFHGNAWIHAAQNNIALCDNLNHLNGVANGPDANRIWVTVNMPEFARVPLPSLMMVNGQSKLALSLPGNGVKCMRHGESPVNSVMVMQEDNLAWSYPWIHGVNSIKADIGMEPQSLWGLTGKSPEINAIEDAIKRDDLYDIYLEGIKNADKYVLKNYLADYIKPQILARL